MILRGIFRNNLPAGIALILLTGFLAMALGTEIYAFWCESTGRIPAYAVGNVAERFLPPSTEHWFGTDYMGRDVLLRAVAGSATAVKVGVIATLIAVLLGTILGLAAGFFGGWIDDLTVWLYSTVAAMPALLFILAFALLVGRNFMNSEVAGVVKTVSSLLRSEPGMLAVYLAIGLTCWVTLCRVVRAETMKLKNQPYVLAARVAGQCSPVILFRHILPNVMHLVIIYFTLTFASAIMSEVIVSYLGMGVQSAPSWGVMIADGQDRMWLGVWWEVAAATTFMFLLVLALNVLGDYLRDTIDPRNRA
ncbi:MAG: ABC transporter permease [Lentisphaeria bacterium]|nr:ABC transporter permease [Lentisphaeria bacterium]